MRCISKTTCGNRSFFWCDSLGDKERLAIDQTRLVILNDEYARFSKAAGLRSQRERAQVAGFGVTEANKARTAAKAIEKQANSMYDIGSTEQNVDAWLRDQKTRGLIGSDKYPLTIHRGRQNKHIPGTHEYMQYQKQLADRGEYGPARLTVDVGTVNKLVEQYHGTGILFKRKDGSWTGKELITMQPDVVGISVNNLTGAEAETTVFMIHYSQKGVHIVPSYPSRKGAKATG